MAKSIRYCVLQIEGKRKEERQVILVFHSFSKVS